MPVVRVDIDWMPVPTKATSLLSSSAGNFKHLTCLLKGDISLILRMVLNYLDWK